MAFAIDCECGQSFRPDHERCPYCATTVPRFWYHESGGPRSAISITIDGAAGYLTDQGPMAISSPGFPVALERAHATAEAMGSSASSRSGTHGSMRDAFVSAVAESPVLILLPLGLVAGGCWTLLPPLLGVFGLSGEEAFGAASVHVAVAVVLFLIFLLVPLASWSGAYLLELSAKKLARKNQPSKWDRWVS